MVSGIGPAETLAKHNISLIADRPGVGQDMWDHIDIEVTWKVGVDGFNTLANLTYDAQQNNYSMTKEVRSTGPMERTTLAGRNCQNHTVQTSLTAQSRNFQSSQLIGPKSNMKSLPFLCPASRMTTMATEHLLSSPSALSGEATSHFFQAPC